MNAPLDGTCWMEDFMPARFKIRAIDTNGSHWRRLFSDIRLREQRLQEMANELIQAGWSVEAPKGRV